MGTVRCPHPNLCGLAEGGAHRAGSMAARMCPVRSGSGASSPAGTAAVAAVAATARPSQRTVPCPPPDGWEPDIAQIEAAYPVDLGDAGPLTVSAYAGDRATVITGTSRNTTLIRGDGADRRVRVTFRNGTISGVTHFEVDDTGREHVAVPVDGSASIVNVHFSGEMEERWVDRGGDVATTEGWATRTTVRGRVYYNPPAAPPKRRRRRHDAA